MGGHCIAPQGYIVDMRHMKRIVEFDEKAKLVTVEAGATWTDLIQFLDPYGLSPDTMQSYSSFSGTSQFCGFPFSSMIISIILYLAQSGWNGECECSRHHK